MTTPVSSAGSPSPLRLDDDHLQPSTVYGPVKSWRFGSSLGIDLIRDLSTCSFNCIYCQLGDIQVKVNERQVFVPTETVFRDLQTVDWSGVDVITFSGSGEPTLALNLKAVLEGLKSLTDKPITVLTNGTRLWDPEVQEALMLADTVSVKLDAASSEGLKQMNRPVEGVTLESIIEGYKAFQARYQGKLCIQTMFMPTNRKELEGLATLIADLKPDELQLNTPKRPYPLTWNIDSRGNHTGQQDYPTTVLKTISQAEAETIEAYLTAHTGVPILTVYPSPEGH